MATDTIKTQTLVFPDQHKALAVLPSASDTTAEIVAALALAPYQAVILLIGGADNMDGTLRAALTQLFSRGIAVTAADSNAIILDGGTKAGVMSLMGEAVADRGYRSPLIGVAPLGAISFPGGPDTGVELEPNHSHFVLPEGKEWGSETRTIFQLLTALTDNSSTAPLPASTPPPATTPAKPPAPATPETSGSSDPAAPAPSAALVTPAPKPAAPSDASIPANGAKAGAAAPSDPAISQGKDPDKIPSVVILAGGGKIARNEMLQSVRQRHTIIVITGSGGLADEIATAWDTRKNTLPAEPILSEIIEEGNLQFHRLSDPFKNMGTLIGRELGDTAVLMSAWETFAEYDLNANRQQKVSDRFQKWIIALGVIITALAITRQFFAHDETDFPWDIIRYLLIILPIFLTLLLTASNRFKQGKKWLLLRSGAESVKREIYRYRTRTKNYRTSAREQLAAKLGEITTRTMATEVNSSSLKPYDKTLGFPPYMDAAKGGDDGFSSLLPDRYVEVRIGDQLNYFKRRTRSLEQRLKLFYWLIYIMAGAGTLLAALDLSVWIALTTSVGAALGTYLAYRQTETTLMKYNQTASNLSNIKAWWNALPSAEQSKPPNTDFLVENTELILQTEMEGWVQQMENALTELRKDQEPSSGKKQKT